MRIAGNPAEIEQVAALLHDVRLVHDGLAARLQRDTLPPMPSATADAVRRGLEAVAYEVRREAVEMHAKADSLARRGRLLLIANALGEARSAAGTFEHEFAGRIWGLLHHHSSRRPGDLADPGAYDDDGGRSVRKDVRLDRFDPAEVVQGGLGDCYFAAAVAAIAATDGGAGRLRKLISRNADGTYTVRFATGAPVRVDGDLYVDDSGRLRYGGGGGGRANWFSILEKAYAVRMGDDYDAIGDGGSPAQVFETLLGDRCVAPLEVGRGTSADAVWSRLSGAQREGRPATIAFTGTSLPGSIPPDDGHAFSVLGTFTKDGHRYVRLRNPWGMNNAYASGMPDDARTLGQVFDAAGAQVNTSPNNGVMTMRVEDLTRVITEVSTG